MLVLDNSMIVKEVLRPKWHIRATQLHRNLSQTNSLLGQLLPLPPISNGSTQMSVNIFCSTIPISFSVNIAQQSLQEPMLPFGTLLIRTG